MIHKIATITVSGKATTKSDTVKDATIETVTIIFPFIGHVTGKSMVLEIIVLRVSETAFHNIKQKENREKDLAKQKILK